MVYLNSLLEIIIRGLTNVTFLTFSGIIISGAFGGLLSAIHLNDGKLSPPERIKITGSIKTELILGYWGDIILGAGAGLIATLPLDLSISKAIYVAVLAGFGGGNFIAKQSKDTEEIRNKASSLPVINNVTTESTNTGLVEIEVETGEEN